MTKHETHKPAQRDGQARAAANASEKPEREEGVHARQRAQAIKEKAHEKAHEEKTVHGHVMSASDIFKFAGLGVFFVVMVIVAVLIWPYVHELFEPGGLGRVLEQVQNAGPGGVVILLVIQFLQIVVAFIPGEVVQIAAGILYGPWLGALVVMVGCVISSAFIFAVVHKLGAPFVQDMVPTKYLEKFRKFEESGKMNMVVFILFLIPGLPKDVFTYLVPLTDMRMRPFLLLSNIGRIPGVVVSTYAAAGIVEGDFVQSAIIFGVTAAIAIVGIVCYDRIMKHFEKKSGAAGGSQGKSARTLDPKDYGTRTGDKEQN